MLTFKDYKECMKKISHALLSDDLDALAQLITDVGRGVIAIFSGVLFGPSYFIYRLANFLFTREHCNTTDINWLYWAGQIVIPACHKKGFACDVESLNPGNSEERNLYFCFNLPTTSHDESIVILREARNRIASTFRLSVLDVNRIYALSVNAGQLRICRREELAQTPQA